MTTELFSGVGVALATLFDVDGEVDLAATAAHAERMAAAGVRAIVTAGSTGEAPALTSEERVAIVRACRDAVPAELPVIAGTGDVSRRQAVALTRAAVDAGADAVLALSPLRTVDPRPYYAAVREAAGGLPVLGYHFPAMSPPGLEVDVLDELGIDGLKDSSGDPERLLLGTARFGGALYTGAAPLVLQAGAIGCRGAILAVANLEPELAIRAFDGDGTAQRELLAAHLEAKARFPLGIKQAMADRYGTSATTRMG